MDLTNGFTPYGYAIIPNLWIRKKGQEIFPSLVYMRLLFRSKYAVKSRLRALKIFYDTRENAFVGSILIRGDSISVIVGRNFLRAQDELQIASVSGSYCSSIDCRSEESILRMLVSSSRSVLASSMAFSRISSVAFCSLFELFEREAFIKHIEQAVEHGLCAGIRVAAKPNAVCC